MDLGTFSLSLAVDDLSSSRAFYESLGFVAFDGDEEGWVMMANGGAKIGLFQGMFEANILTFNPPDARAIEARVVKDGHKVISPTEGDSGPATLMLADPDGNIVMFDQHEDGVPSPDSAQ